MFNQSPHIHKSHGTIAASSNAAPTSGFSFSANPVTVNVGQTQTSQVTITSVAPFSGDVYLVATSTLLFASLNPTRVTLTSGGISTATLSVTASNNAVPGNYYVGIEGTSGCTNFNSAIVDVTVTGPDFTIASDKTQISVPPGNSGSALITLTSKNNLAASISLSTSAFPTGPTLSLAPTVTLASGGSASSILMINVPTGTNPGNYTVSVDGRVGFFLNHAIYILLIVPGPTFDLSATPDTLTLLAGGASNDSAIAIIPAGGFTGSVSLTNMSFAIGLISATLGTANLAIPGQTSTTLTVRAPSGTTPGDYSIFMSATSGTISQFAIVNIHVKTPDFELNANPDFVTIVSQPCTSTVTATGIDGFSGVIQLASKGPASGPVVTPATSTISVPGTPSSVLTISAPPGTLPGFYTIEVNGTSSSPANFHQKAIEVVVVGPDFSLSSNPPSITVVAGGTGTSTISANGLFGFSTTSAISLASSSDDPDVIPTLQSTSLTVGSSTMLSVLVSGTHLTGGASINVTGTSGSLRHSIFVDIVIFGPGFSLSANPTTISTSEKVSQSSTVTVAGLDGFTGMVTVNAITSPNLNATVQPANVNAPGHTTLSVNSTIPGTYTVELFGNATIGGNEIFNYTSVTVTILGPDFSLVAHPMSLTVVAGSSSTTIISLSPLNGFNSQAQLTATGSGGLTANPVPSSIDPLQDSILTIIVDASTNAGTYTVDVQGTSGSLVRDVMVTVNVASFTISASPNALTIVNGTSGTASIQITGQNGFLASVDLTAAVPLGISPSFNPPFIMGTGTSTLTLAVLNAAPGTYLVNVTGKSGMLSHNAAIIVTVPKPDFTIDPSSRVIVDCSPRSTCPQPITLTAQNGFVGQILLTTSSSTPTGLTCGPLSLVESSGSESLSCESPSPADYNVTVTGTSGALSHTTGIITYHVSLQPDFSIAASKNAVGPLNAHSSDSTVTITISQLNGFTGTVILTATPSQGLTATVDKYSIQGTGTAQLSLSAALSGNYSVIITGTSSSLSHSTSTITVVVVDFAISATQPSAADAGTSLSSTITVSALNHFAGTVNLVPGASSSLNCQSINPGSVTGFGSASLSCSANSAGTFSETITATSGSLLHSVTISFNFEDFTVASTSPSKAGTSQQSISTITVSGQNGFSGTVYLTVQQPAGLTCNPPTTTTLTATGSATVSCTSSAAGSYTLNVTGTSGPLTHESTAVFAFAAPDFGVATQDTSLSFNNGTSASTTIIISPQYGFSGMVNLSVSAPNGLTCSLSTTSIQPSGTSSLSCIGNSPGDYTVKLTAQSGSLSHSTNLNVHVASVSHVPPAPSSSNATILYVIIAVVVIAVVGIVLVLTRVRRTKA